ncbi:MAG: hypothetical protein AAGD00_02320 [Planctomycetota bacterium]
MSEHEDPKAVIEHRHAGLTITLPPHGFEGPRRTFLIQAVVFGGAAFIVSLFLVWFFILRGLFQWGSLVTLPFPLAIGGFGSLLVHSVFGFHTRRGTIEVSGQPGPGATLSIAQRSVFGSRSASWTAAELESVGVGDPIDAPGRMPTAHLLITARDGVKRGFFPERQPEELMELAVVLSEALGLDPPGS